MKDEKFDKLLQGLRTAYQSREFVEPSEKFSSSVSKRIRYLRAAESMAEVSGNLFETAILRFATTAAAIALILVVYGGTQGVGITSSSDLLPEDAVELLITGTELIL